METLEDLKVEMNILKQKLAASEDLTAKVEKLKEESEEEISLNATEIAIASLLL